jgi:hypothetical protein
MNAEMKIWDKPGRFLAVLAGAALLAAAMAGGGPVAAVTRGAGHPVSRAAALAFLLHHGTGPAELAGHGLRAPAPLQGRLDVPEPGTASVLFGVFCTSPVNCWAVGEYSPNGQADLNEVLHWNGAAWAQVSAPSPGGSATGDANLLTAVRCTGATNCWAVGFSQPNGGALLNEALHWNGTKWTVVPTPTPGGVSAGSVNQLNEVVCAAAANCWAVGGYGSSSSAILNQVLHWNGHRWALVPVPNPAGTASADLNALNSVCRTSASNCLAVGTSGSFSPFAMVNEALHWNGTTWSQVSTPNPGGTGAGAFNGLNGLGCTTATNCWAVGSYGTFTETSFNQAMHWNGTAWTQIVTPQPNSTSQELLFVSCQSGINCWAVGDSGSISGTTGVVLDQALHWDGATWSAVDTPELGRRQQRGHQHSARGALHLGRQLLGGGLCEQQQRGRGRPGAALERDHLVRRMICPRRRLFWLSARGR